jgi:hypothetical protein
MPGQWGADRLTGVGVPQPHRAILARRGQPLPVGTERDIEYAAGVPDQGVHHVARISVPDPDCLIVTSSLDEASRCTSGLNTTPLTTPACPMTGDTGILTHTLRPPGKTANTSGQHGAAPTGTRDVLARIAKSASEVGHGRCRGGADPECPARSQRDPTRI